MNSTLYGSNFTNEDKERQFDSFINKTIIGSSKNYFEKQMKTKNTERTIVDDENSALFLYDFISVCDNSRTEEKIDLTTALLSLSSIEQEVISLLYKENLSQDEAAKILEICSKSVSRIKIRAISKLKNQMRGDSIYEE